MDMGNEKEEDKRSKCTSGGKITNGIMKEGEFKERNNP